MKQVQFCRIMAAGKNITIVGSLLLFSCILPFVAVLHLSNLGPIDLDQREIYQGIYGISYLILSIAIMIHVFIAGNNLSLCDVDEEESRVLERQIVYRETIDNKTLRIISINHETIGAEVYIENGIAPDGECQYLNDNRKPIVKDEKIERLLN